MPYESFVYIRGEESDDDGLKIERPVGFNDNQVGPCPDCGGEWVWYEAGYVPGTRKCLDCGSMFNFKVERNVDNQPLWFLVREKFYR